MNLTEWHHLGRKILASFPHASQEAKWLIAGALEKDPSYIILNPSYVPSPAEGRQIQDWLRRRVAGEPLSRIKGMREFWSLPFYLNAHTLDPRPDTEVVVEGVLQWVGERKTDPWTILDLGTGSGCILISLLHELPNARGLGVDISEDALSVARRNASANGVDLRTTFQQGNWAENVTGPFNIIVSNPPYIALKDEETLAQEVRFFDPPQALFGGEDGLACYRMLATQVKSLLSPQGLAIFEIGAGQRKGVEALFHQVGFKTLFILSDLAGIERVIGLFHV